MTRTKLGAALWILCLQYFFAEAVSISGWLGPYSLSRNYISDLGAVGCGIHAAGIAGATGALCSPLHAVMNGSFLLQGVLIIGGAWLLSARFPKGLPGVVALGLVAASGAGVILVGLAPEDVQPGLHFLGAFENLLTCNAGMAMFGFACLRGDSEARSVGWISLGFGLIGLVALGLFGAGVDLGLGVGGMERVVAYPFPLWLAGMGVRFLRARDREPALSWDDQIVAGR